MELSVYVQQQHPLWHDASIVIAVNGWKRLVFTRLLRIVANTALHYNVVGTESSICAGK